MNTTISASDFVCALVNTAPEIIEETITDSMSSFEFGVQEWADNEEGTLAPDFDYYEARAALLYWEAGGGLIYDMVPEAQARWNADGYPMPDGEA